MEVKIQNVSRSFGNQFALKDICLSFPEGSKIGLIGPNGSGKSTLIRLIMDLINLDQGEIQFLFKSSSPVRKNSTEEKNRENKKYIKSLKALSFQDKKKIAYVPQIFPYFSSPLKDVVQTIKDIHGFPMESFQNILKTFSLDYPSILHRPFHKLSGGMKQKILIALSFASQPDLLLLDEPTSSLDPLSRQIFYKMCFHLKKGKSLILCSHRLEEIRHLIDKIIVLQEGSVIYFGSASTYLKKRTLCLTEVLVKPSQDNQQILNQMGFTHSSSSWWHKIFNQEEKLDILQKLQKKIGKDIENIIIRDVDRGSDLID